ncbi:PTS lactose/cellobiose transporter subunit IIA [Desmospora activa]|uniref:PTS system lichenan oligosaccharide-specific IIA component (Lac family) n=1 Tax=Desmospora activa DSM 45169 TaxID=1121389 RepID=A0A2T4Z7L9_9BACL|nr:PTS lactose/cellobiose transporter subunit IIA [Desmospora activa]PTM57890.1 PTS system lichenan oligosaccharide-specific IIA component (Lac family) [Desmospora activa DSM 45169]
MDAMEGIMFQLILHGGNGKSFAMEAIAEAKTGHMSAAREKLRQAGEELHKAHQLHANLIQQEAGGEQTTVTLLMVHAQDHLMNALTVKDLASEMVDLYERIMVDGGIKA